MDIFQEENIDCNFLVRAYLLLTLIPVVIVTVTEHFIVTCHARRHVTHVTRHVSHLATMTIVTWQM